ncbi:helix-turn-helix domain-containing protein [Holdemania sp. Marseille-P2844]|uniref:helix-turn-helix domain-containing protein n=1 Tax=Holdemania sp. Marseille-P2844 TaxID=1852366 RepID=UPI0009F87FCD|nr:helix-turn-helix domain-containing protein [Holdemania sp. Marseille-P2844]
MTINERVRALRKELGMNQTEFGERIALSQGHLTSVEQGKRAVTDRTIKLICTEFGVSEDWLRTGKEPKYLNDDDSSLFRQAAAGIEMVDDKRAMAALEVYWSLSPDDKKVIWTMLDQIYEKVHKKKSSD